MLARVNSGYGWFKITLGAGLRGEVAFGRRRSRRAQSDAAVAPIPSVLAAARSSRYSEACKHAVEKTYSSVTVTSLRF